MFRMKSTNDKHVPRWRQLILFKHLFVILHFIYCCEFRKMYIKHHLYVLYRYLDIPGGGEGLAGERDGVGAGRGGAALHDAAVRLQRAHHGRAQRRVGGEDVQLVRLLDVDGEVGDGLTALLQHSLGLLVAHGGQVQQYLQYSVKTGNLVIKDP